GRGLAEPGREVPVVAGAGGAGVRGERARGVGRGGGRRVGVGAGAGEAGAGRTGEDPADAGVEGGPVVGHGVGPLLGRLFPDRREEAEGEKRGFYSVLSRIRMLRMRRATSEVSSTGRRRMSSGSAFSALKHSPGQSSHHQGCALTGSARRTARWKDAARAYRRAGSATSEPGRKASTTETEVSTEAPRPRASSSLARA